MNIIDTTLSTLIFQGNKRIMPDKIKSLLNQKFSKKPCAHRQTSPLFLYFTLRHHFTSPSGDFEQYKALTSREIERKLGSNDNRQ